MPHVDVGGAQLEYVEQGAGDPIVLVHGVLGDYRSWRSQMEPFSRRHRVVAYSRRNHYPNPWSDTPDDYSLSLERDDLVGLIGGLGLGKVHLVGSSYGGAVAALAARDSPEAVRTLVLNDPALRGVVAQTPGSAQVIERSAQVIALTRERLAAGRLEDGARIWVDAVMGEGAFVRLPPAMREVMMQNARPLRFEMSEQAQPFTCQDAGRIGMPTLLVRGDQTLQMFGLIAARLAECIPHSESVVVPNATHAPSRQNPQFFNDSVLGFIAKH